MAMTSVRGFLVEGETVKWSSGYHWMAFVRSVWWAVFALPISLTLAVEPDTRRVGRLVLLAVLALIVYRVIDWLLRKLVVTDSRIFEVSGVVFQQVDTLPIKALTDQKYRRSLLGRLLGYGEFYVESAGQDQALSRIRYVKGDMAAYQSILGEVFRD